MQTLKIRNQFFNQPKDFIGLITTQKSCTIPGQDFTPQEILRNFTQGRHAPEHQFLDAPVHSFTTMSIQDKMDYLKNLAQTNNEQKTQISLKLKQVAKDFQLKQKAEQDALLKEKLKKEIKNDDEKIK